MEKYSDSDTRTALTGADKLAYAFYATAAAAALVGQVWAGVTHIPWPETGFSTFLKVVIVTPAVAVLELGGVATAALADLRRRKGEQAYAYRAMSLAAAIIAVVFNVIGHWRPEERFLAFGFGGLSAFAYILWLIHSGARRRDVLRQAGQMANTGPVYGLVQWVREPRITWKARELAIEHGHGLYDSLHAAREHHRTSVRRAAIASTVADYIRSEHKDERLAKIAETTYDPDRIAVDLERRADYDAVTGKLAAAIAVTAVPEDAPRQVEQHTRPALPTGTSTGETTSTELNTGPDEQANHAVLHDDQVSAENAATIGPDQTEAVQPQNGSTSEATPSKILPARVHAPVSSAHEDPVAPEEEAPHTAAPAVTAAAPELDQVEHLDDTKAEPEVASPSASDNADVDPQMTPKAEPTPAVFRTLEDPVAPEEKVPHTAAPAVTAAAPELDQVEHLDDTKAEPELALPSASDNADVEPQMTPKAAPKPAGSSTTMVPRIAKAPRDIHPSHIASSAPATNDKKAHGFALIEAWPSDQKLTGPALAKKLDCAHSYARKIIKWHEEETRTNQNVVNLPARRRS